MKNENQNQNQNQDQNETAVSAPEMTLTKEPVIKGVVVTETNFQNEITHKLLLSMDVQDEIRDNLLLGISDQTLEKMQLISNAKLQQIQNSKRLFRKLSHLQIYAALQTCFNLAAYNEEWDALAAVLINELDRRANARTYPRDIKHRYPKYWTKSPELFALNLSIDGADEILTLLLNVSQKASLNSPH